MSEKQSEEDQVCLFNMYMFPSSEPWLWCVLQQTFFKNAGIKR